MPHAYVEAREQIGVLVLPFLSCKFQESNSGYQANYWQMRLPTEPSHWPQFFFLACFSLYAA